MSAPGKLRIRVASRALGGERLEVFVFVYDDLERMRREARSFSGFTAAGDDTVGVTQAWHDGEERVEAVIVRLHRDWLGTTVMSHEMHHAATALYGARVGDRISRKAHLTHYNEPFAHLYSDLLGRLVGKLYKAGFYTR